jgi:AsmA family protein
MRTSVKLLAGVGILLAVLIVGIVIAISTIDVNTLVGPVKDRVKAATGRELTVGGDSKLTLSLRPKLLLKDVALSNAPWGSAPKLLTAQRLEVEFALLPLLSRRFELIEVALVGPVISLEIDGTGRKNWAQEHAPPSGLASAETGPAPAVSVGSLMISDGTLTFRDGTNAPTRVAIDRLSLRARDPSAPMKAEFRGQVAGVALSIDGTLGSLQDLLQARATYPVQIKGDVAGQKTAITAKVQVDGKNVVLDDLDMKIGANALAGKLSVISGEPRSKLVFNLAGPALLLKEIPLPAATGAPPVASRNASSRLFPDTPVDWAPLRMFDAEGSLALGRLQLHDGRQLDNLHVQLTLSAGKLDVQSFEFAMFGGKLAGRLSVDAHDAGHESLTLRTSGHGFDLGAILSASGKPREVRGGKTEITADLAMRGASPHAWASTATGNVRIVVGVANLLNTKLDLTSAFDKVVQAVNPFRERDPSTDLVCAVVRLPLANGVAKIDRSIAMETQKIGISASGTLDFRNETLDFTFRPKIRKGLSIGIPNFADFVGVRGPFASPQVAVNAAGSAKAIVSIGAAVGTAGLSSVGQALVGQVESGGPGPCAVALGTTGSPSDESVSNPGKGAGPQSVERKIGGAIGKLFGR